MEQGIETKKQSKVFSHLSATLLAILFVFMMSQFELDGLKGILFDAQYRFRWWTQPHPDIALVAFENTSTLSRHESQTRLPIDDIIRVFDVLAEEKPKAVGIIGSLNDKLYTVSELKRLSESFAKVPNTVIGYTDDENLGKPIPAGLGQSVKYLPGFISRDNFSYGADSVSRRVMLTIDGIPSLFTELTRIYRANAEAPVIQHAHPFRGNESSIQTYIHWQGPAGTYVPVSTQSVVDRRFPKGSFHNKIVLFSTVLSSKGDSDFIYTPYSREPLKTSMLEGAANSLATLLRNDAIYKSSSLFNTLLAFFVGILTVNLVLFLSPGRGIMLVLGEVLFLLVASWFALVFFDCWVDLAHPIVVACVGYYLVIPYRLVDEYRKRWHYQEKSEMMVQLEQLKSNFLSLISHDLKTPIARIQGNAELALNESKAMTEKEKKWLSAIVNTTDDLSQYVETILDLTRIESAKIPVNKSSKDINATIQEVVESKKAMAAEKNITLVTELEPLFSFKFDARLIRRVLSNLVENAIKYSPPDSRIKLSSAEKENWIRVSIADEGIGIAPEEQPRVFQKFYRCENALARDVKGTGLGLYLVKYFVELHRGIVDLESEVGKGSIFTVSLPA